MRSDAMELDSLRPADFARLVGQPLPLAAAGIALELVEVRPLPAHRHRAEPFTLLFRGPVERPLGQGMVALDVPDGGSLEIFLVPVRRDASGLFYEAVFN